MNSFRTTFLLVASVIVVLLSSCDNVSNPSVASRSDGNTVQQVTTSSREFALLSGVPTVGTQQNELVPQSAVRNNNPSIGAAFSTSESVLPNTGSIQQSPDFPEIEPTNLKSPEAESVAHSEVDDIPSNKGTSDELPIGTYCIGYTPKSSEVLDLAILLVEHLNKASASTFVIEDSESCTNTSINLLTDTNSGFGNQEFQISGVNSIVQITAGTPVGLKYGIYSFLETDIGISWLFPGEIGVYYPEVELFNLEVYDRKEKPAYENRKISGTLFRNNKDAKMWFDKMRFADSQAKFHHNLLNVFDPYKYYELYPDLYPDEIVIVDENESLDYPYNNKWNPVLSHEQAIPIGRDYIIQELENGEDWISFGINDFNNWDREELEKSPLNSIDRRNLSNYYFGWVNDVVESVIESIGVENYKIGALAYRSVLDAPTINVAENLVPYLTFDRYRWSSPEIMESDQKRIREWSDVTTEFGLYDYLYGDQFYSIPRMYPNIIEESIRYAHSLGATSYYGEAYPSENWIEGPKLYIVSKMLWDTSLSSIELTRKWCEKAVGELSGQFLYDFYDFWEIYWTTRVPNSNWFNENKTVEYLDFKDDSYISELTIQDLDYTDDLMKKMLESAEGSQFGARAKFIHNSWMTSSIKIREQIQ